MDAAIDNDDNSIVILLCMLLHDASLVLPLFKSHFRLCPYFSYVYFRLWSLIMIKNL